jgi:hypothetical protein
MAILGRKVLDPPLAAAKSPGALTLFPQLTQSRQGLGPLSCSCSVLRPSLHSLNRVLGSTLLSLVLHHLEFLPVLSWDPTSLSFGGISPFLLREQVVTPCLRNWCRSQLDLVEKKASHF